MGMVPATIGLAFLEHLTHANYATCQQQPRGNVATLKDANPCLRRFSSAAVKKPYVPIGWSGCCKSCCIVRWLTSQLPLPLQSVDLSRDDLARNAKVVFGGQR